MKTTVTFGGPVLSSVEIQTTSGVLTPCMGLVSRTFTIHLFPVL